MSGTTTRATRDRFHQAVIAVLAYVPLLANDAGRLAADTKAYLYLDPARLLARAPYMWQPEFGLGTVTHQNIGYLWPIGPFFLGGEAVGLPDWVVQRLWLGTVLLGAGLGVRWFLRTLGWKGGGVLVASLAYMLSPYLLNYVDRHSVILLPWAGLPWLLALAQRSLRTPGWRHPALFGLVTLTVGGVNASSLLLVGLGPVVWLVWSGLDRSAPWRRVVATTWRIGVVFVATGLWWMVGLAVQAAHGLPTLRLTENYRVVSDAATAPELFRGLGYWYFYGQGRLGGWVEPATSYTRWALPLSFVLPLLGLLIASLVRFRHRGHVLALMVVGLLIGVGAHPYDAPSPLGRLFQELTLTDAGLALRSTPRVLPLAVLGTAVLLGAGVEVVARWRPRLEAPVVLVACALIVANLSPMWRGEMLGELVQRPEDVPDYWHETAAHLDARPHNTRVLEIPGTDFAVHRWGNSGDPLLPGLMDRSHASRELIPLGTEASAALMVAFDTEIQEGRFDPDGLAPFARLLGAGDVVFRADLQYERFRTPRPPDLWADLQGAPGFGEPVGFGERVPNLAGPERPLLDEHTLARPAGTPDPFQAVVLPVVDPVGILRVADPDRAIILTGDAEGLVAAAGEGLIQPGRPVLFSATLAGQPDVLRDLAGPGARIVITDTNRKDGQRWGTIRETAGYTERADEQPMRNDLSDHRLAVPGGQADHQTVALQSGLRVSASAYGNPVTFTAGDRPFHAVDGSLATAWTVGAFNHVIGERLVLELSEPAPVPSLTVLQAALEGQNRWITDLRVHLDDTQVDVVLDDTSRSVPGQVIQLPNRVVGRIVLEIQGTDVGTLDYYAGVTGVGFAEVTVAGVTPDETLRMPVDLAAALGPDRGAELVILATRRWSDPLDPIRADPEESLDRSFTIPWARTFDIRGEVRISPYASEDLIDEMLWSGESTATASERLPGDLRSGGRSAFDGDPETVWQSRFGDPTGATVTLATDGSIDYQDLTLTYLADRYHSTPSRVTVLADDGPVASLALPGKAQAREGRITVGLPTGGFSSRTLTVRLDKVAQQITMDWYSGLPKVLPVGIVEVGGVPVGNRPAMFDTGCRSDLLQVDGLPRAIRVSGSSRDALAGRPLVVENCGEPIHLDAGNHRISTAPGRLTGLALDRLVASSDPTEIAPVAELPTLRVLEETRTSYDIEVVEANEPFWLILGQSHSSGWRLTGPTGTVADAPLLVDGYANGWLVDPGEATGPLRLGLTWTPQRWVWAALAISLLGALGALVLAVRGRPDRGCAPDPVRAAGLRRRAFTGAGGWRSAAMATGIVGFCLANLPSWPVAALVMGIGYTLVERCRLPRSAPTVAALLAMASAVVMIAVDQIRFRYPRDFVWPLFFEQYHVLGVVAILCLAVAAVSEMSEQRCSSVR